MSQLKKWETSSNSSEETEQLAANLGKSLKGGEVIELVGDLGSGKTTFVRGLARGMGSKDHVASPTFTLSRQYRAGELTLNHFDFYRLGEAGIMSNELDEIIEDKQGVTVIEWADVASQTLPKERLIVKLSPQGETSRKIIFSYPVSLNNLIEKIR